MNNPQVYADDFIAVGSLNNTFDYLVIKNPIIKEEVWRELSPGDNIYGFGKVQQGMAAHNRYFFTDKDTPLTYRGKFFDESTHKKWYCALEFIQKDTKELGLRTFIMLYDADVEFWIDNTKNLSLYITRPVIVHEPITEEEYEQMLLEKKLKTASRNKKISQS